MQFQVTPYFSKINHLAQFLQQLGTASTTIYVFSINFLYLPFHLIEKGKILSFL